MKYQHPSWVENGMTVWLPWDRDKGTALRCTVAVAAGKNARVVNEKRNVDKWVDIEDLLVPPGDPHTESALLEGVVKTMMGRLP